ncbi:hypothetical protein [Coralloluteibacterium thermophilus]|uniref:Uncharacterized protein n=1 Tax=Coralloluteibacterium thermophilum TaxID=2707049 RepID=A0ABV9NN20_9GAMM
MDLRDAIELARFHASEMRKGIDVGYRDLQDSLEPLAAHFTSDSPHAAEAEAVVQAARTGNLPRSDAHRIEALADAAEADLRADR